MKAPWKPGLQLLPNPLIISMVLRQKKENKKIATELEAIFYRYPFLPRFFYRISSYRTILAESLIIAKFFACKAERRFTFFPAISF
jgi:hypothetical protein